MEEEEPMEEEPAEEMVEPAENILAGENAAIAPEFFDQEALDQEVAWIDAVPEGPEDMVWEQYIDPEWVDTTEYAKDGPYTICFSNAGVNNPWRVVGFNTMEHQVALETDIGEWIHVDAEGSDEKQIADIEDLLASGNCDGMIISPNTTAALTPIVEQACEQLPVVVFDRGVFTDCPVSFVRPIGGYAFGHLGAEFIVDNLPDGGNVLAFRILPGVDVLENRWAAAKVVFENNPQITVIGVEFTEGDNARTKAIVEDHLDRFGQIDAIWMDAGATAVAAIEAFEDAGLDIPIMVGEDQQDFLKKWQDEGLTAVAPTFPTFQWRTAVIAMVNILQGEQVPAWWVLPQPPVTADNLDSLVNASMPPLHYAMCGCEGMPGFPEDWGGQ
ncbi:MAG: ABC transporter substrate-binding protein [Chloroflexi bacterium]|nr:MAG: ABC transporter substrate-binding protein [Chloroflexota bacterium]MBL1196479.1 ABC transporter substrate-binding protein [Chloroflexota bacterium]NOH13774.1 ABC transporter substrate-binding protein [Chloroflexota bacterium]